MAVSKKPFILATIIGISATIGAFTLSSSKATDELPKPVQLVADQGVNIVGEFQGPSGITGYVGEFNGNGMTIYLTEDGEHALIGTLINAEGQDIGREYIRDMVEAPRYSEAWNELEQATWVAEGSDDADNIVYTFTDPFCPYCHRMHESMQPYIESGQIQLRHLLVGIIRQESPSIAATITGASDPTAALLEHMRNYRDGGISADDDARSQGQSAVTDNQRIMRSLNLTATPATFYKDSDGVVQLLRGAPTEAQIQQML